MDLPQNKGKVWCREKNNGCKDLEVEQAGLVKKLEARGVQWVSEGCSNKN